MNKYKNVYFKKVEGDNIIDSIMLYTDINNEFVSFGNCDIMLYPKEGSFTDHVIDGKVNYISDLYLHNEFLKNHYGVDTLSDNQKNEFVDILMKNFIFINSSTNVFFEDKINTNGN